MYIIKKIIGFFIFKFVEIFANLFNNRVLIIFSARLNEKLNPVITIKDNKHEYNFSIENELTLGRANTLFSKEPETIEWIDTFSKEDILYDIGANIGLYTIYAAVNNSRVFAFEPEAQNYALLNKNIYLNNLSDKVTALNIALSDSYLLDKLYMPDFIAGGALNNFGDNKDWNKNKFEYVFKQGMISFSLDSLIKSFNIDFPNHIKIDVDGLESKIIQGALNTLKDNRLKSLLVELNDKLPEDQELIDIIQSCGLKLLFKKHSKMVENSIYSDGYNYIFVRQ